VSGARYEVSERRWRERRREQRRRRSEGVKE